ncbi:DUF4832 domain-containing protein [Marinoscillum sp.]|uniref:DUF4832 domain-containing protein n=1 Tax=Marinoscillum sp. TaxID=2024838 RepID=UPI003BAC3F87
MKFIHVFLMVLVASICWSQEMINQTYNADETVIANPERGLYHHTEAHSENYVNLNSETLKSYRESESITQVLRVFYLEKYRDKAISQSYLDNVRKDFSAIRNAGIKCIVRFAYSTGTSAPYNDATPEIVQTHIGQLKPILRENADVIQVMQAGFIGTWGEWYYTDHFAQSPGQLTAEDWQNRLEVVESLLDALPDNRMIQIRTPGYKMNLFDTEEALTESDAFDGSNISRVGHHNDCFVASSSDYGTYVNPDVEKPYLEQETLFTPMGGETCNVSPPISDCENSLSELQRFHWSYLNVDYNTSVLSEWKEQGCYEDIELSLGYRLRLIEASVSNQAKPGGMMQLNINLINDGYANLYNPRDLYAILIHTETGEKYQVKLDTNPRLWPLNEAFSINASLGIPESIPLGEYEVNLWMPDSYESLRDNPAYSVRLANEGTWQSETGYNELDLDLTVIDDANLSDYTDDLFFEMIGMADLIEVEGSSELSIRTGNSNALLVWPPQNSSLNRVLQRSEDGSSFVTIASMGGKSLSFKDVNVTPGTTYYYRYYLSDNESQTDYSDTVEVTISEEKLTEINVDGETDEWYDLPPVGYAYSKALSTLNVFFGSQEVYFYLSNCTSYTIFLNADNSTETGDQNGMDYRFHDGELFVFDNENWTTAGSLVEAQNATNVEFSTSLTNIPLAAGAIELELVGEVDAEQLTDEDGGSIQIFRTLPPDIPQNITIGPDEVTPYSIELTWQECENCDGYYIERSTSETSGFELIKEYNSTRTNFRDFDLEPVMQYYRMSSFNELGQSNYSDVVSMTPTALFSVISSKITVYPNPTSNLLYFDEPKDEIQVIGMSGSVVMKKHNTQQISMENLPMGIYIIKARSANKENSYRVIRQ